MSDVGDDRYAWIRERVARVPRIRLALTPTPLEEAKNLSRVLGGPRILIKRDDLTGVAFGGNKLRNLEFRLARTMAERPDTVIVGLDIQSNSARQTIGACNKLGLTTILVLEGCKPDIVQGNLLVDYLLGAEVLLGRRLTNAGHAVHGVTATDEFHVPSRTAAIANETLDVLGLDMRVTEDEIVNDLNFVGAGYGIPTEASVEATRLFARTEGVILDPVYTGKAPACMLAHIRQGRYARDDTLVFVHTGGTPAIFTWSALWL